MGRSTIKKAMDSVLVIFFIGVILYLIYYSIYNIHIFKGTDKELKEIFSILVKNKMKPFNTVMTDNSISLSNIVDCLSPSVNIPRRLTEKIIKASLDKKVNRWFFLERIINSQIKAGNEYKLTMLLEQEDPTKFKKLLDLLIYTVDLDINNEFIDKITE
ncbi:hypothetical protein NEPAR06_1104 [Nematocida parisii]|uniref:uncharacterized protein n=1 Tax=Nematocida parisii (strain ERTm1 / ATCC PRA-289) TaxID=881290 RepID=UPI000264BA9D|nr:uncharacterized protein NEPG_01752 [Nematocida parisii ERTm1]EIJ93410.1 hypothetical protein NEPG_01752 [Nematocida parisii ERTm1]KAI5154419.1 hypothetical protein NEPAR06_1104 [Nematocida parisii]|eukprot:XP_013059580.1 hypothetical protein NEPG_01752 [Nematocida parisii ERTm1]